MHVVARTLSAVLACALAALLFCAPAGAHALLTGSDPADGAQLDQAPAAVTLTFNETPQQQFSTVVVTGPDGRDHVVGEPTISGRDLRVAVDGLDVSGAYTVAYRIVSTDGHPVSGQYRFTLTLPASLPASAAETTSAAPITEPAAEPEAAPATADNGVSAWPFVVGAVVLAAAIALVVWLRSRRGPQA